jgi:integrase
MGTVFKKTVTRPLPKGAELFTKQGQQFARWKPSKGRARTAKVTTGKDGSTRILTEAGTYTAKYRDGEGIVCEVSTGCRDEGAARSVLATLERRAELVKANVITASEDRIADHQSGLLSGHTADYLQSLRAKDVSAGYLKETKRLINRIVTDCEFKRIGDIDLITMERWLVARKTEGMSARTRNSHVQAVAGFCSWAVKNQRLASNPLSRIGKADEKSDKRRQRRSLTESELLRLLEMARWRPLAEFGREPVPVEGTAKRSNWKKAALTPGNLQAAVERARDTLKDNPEFIAEKERLGRERALIYKTLVLTGLRKGELASLTVGQLELDGATPYAVLAAADEKNRQGASVPLRSDLAEDLRDWISDAPKAATLRLRRADEATDAGRKVFNVPAGLIRILNRDLQAAGIAKRDERGRTVDVHALRHSFGTLLSKGGVSPRTAQAAMRHSKIDLTMNVYTDPKLLDVHGALDALPTLDLDSSPQTEAQAIRATGTESRDAGVASNQARSFVAPNVAPTAGNPGHLESLPVALGNLREGQIRASEGPQMSSEPQKKSLIRCKNE